MATEYTYDGDNNVLTVQADRAGRRLPEDGTTSTA